MKKLTVQEIRLIRQKHPQTGNYIASVGFFSNTLGISAERIKRIRATAPGTTKEELAALIEEGREIAKVPFDPKMLQQLPDGALSADINSAIPTKEPSPDAKQPTDPSQQQPARPGYGDDGGVETDPSLD